MLVKKLCYFQLTVLCCSILLLSLSALVCSKKHGNVANDLLDIINSNRTSQHLSNLTNNAGLGCMALQFAEQCLKNCSNNSTMQCQPPEDDFTEIFAPNCGVELPTFGTISGYILGCHKKYVRPQEAFEKVLVKDQETVSTLGNRTYMEAGAGVVGRRKGKGPYVWCVLFSSGLSNETFVLEDLGRGIEQKRGCYSGSSMQCSTGAAGYKKPARFWSISILLVFSFQVLVSGKVVKLLW